MAGLQLPESAAHVPVRIYAKNGHVHIEAGDADELGLVTGKGPGLFSAWQSFLEDVSIDLMSPKPTATAMALGAINKVGGG